MKYLYLSLFIYIFSSCGNTEELSETIIGTWKMTSFTIFDCPNPTGNLDTVNADEEGCLNAKGDVLCQFFIFNNSGIATLTSVLNNNVSNFELTYTVDNSVSEISFCASFNDCYTMTVIDDVMRFDGFIGDCTTTTTFEKS